MSNNNCNREDFERVRKNIQPADTYECERLRGYMNLVKYATSFTTGIAGYLTSAFLAQDFTNNKIVPKLIGGLTAIALAKLVSKPAARAGLDLGLRVG